MAHGTFNWNELLTGDVEKAKAFYAATVGWTFDTMPMPVGSYTIAKAGDKMAGGITSLDMTPPGTPPHWFAYLEVDNVDERVVKVAANGGKVMREPFDIPDVGRIAIVQDPTGAYLGFMTPAASGG